jgi:hypothetical protein
MSCYFHSWLLYSVFLILRSLLRISSLPAWIEAFGNETREQDLRVALNSERCIQSMVFSLWNLDHGNIEDELVN